MKLEISTTRVSDGNPRLLLREAEQLVAQFGETADLVAAQLADVFFQSGDSVAGSRWTAIFQIVAAWHSGSGTASRSEFLMRYH